MRLHTKYLADLSDADKLLWAHKYVACLESAVERQSAAEIVYAAFLDAARRADASDPPSTSFTLFDFPDGTSRYMYVSPARGASATSEGPIPGSVGPKHGGVAIPAIIKTDCSS